MKRPDPNLLADGAILAPYEQADQYVMQRVEVGHPDHARFYAEIQHAHRREVEHLRARKTSPVTWFVTAVIVFLVILPILVDTSK